MIFITAITGLPPKLILITSLPPISFAPLLVVIFYKRKMCLGSVQFLARDCTKSQLNSVYISYMTR